MRWYDRLRRSGEIAFVRRRGRHAGFETLRAYAAEAGLGPVRVGVTVSKAVGPAVTRNLVRRRIQGALDALPPPPVKRRFLFVANPTAAGASYDRLAADVAAALRQLAALR